MAHLAGAAAPRAHGFWALARAAVLGAAPALCAVAAASPPDDVGRQIFEGRHPTLLQTTLAQDPRARLPAEQAACVACHRPSGLGSFEGGSAVPPISSGTLSQPYDPATTRRYAPSGQLRVRPAYDAAALHKLLTQGLMSDGLPVGGLMPRYDLTLAQSAALLAHLNALGSAPTPGVEETQVHFATITTDELDASQERDLLTVMTAFFTQKNAATRSETGRRASAERNQQVMYSRYRKWTLHHWRLTGAPDTWPAQLAQAYARQPVFGVLSGASPRDWTPVHVFCEAQRMPCLLPVTPLPGPADGFYAVYFSAGLVGQARWLAREVVEREPAAAGAQWVVLTADGAASRAQGEQVAQTLRQGGLRAQAASHWSGQTRVVSALNATELASRLPPPAAGAPQQIYLLAGAAPAQPGREELALWRRSSQIRWVTQQNPGPVPLARARAWWRGKPYQPRDEAFAAQVLLALQTAVETLVHVDERFSREYCLEKLEHNLENMPPLTAYPRLSLGPAQRTAARQVWTLEDR